MSEPIDYRSLLQAAYVELTATRAQAQVLEAARTAPIAVVGMGCRFPGGSDSPAAFWRLLAAGVDAVGPIPPDRWDVDAYYSPDRAEPGKMYTRQGAFLQGVDLFDPLFFGIAPREAVGLDPQQRLLLEVCWEALENASIAPDRLAGSNTGLFVGLFMDDYAGLAFHSGDPERIDAYSTLGSLRSMAAGRLAYLLDIHGPVVQLDTACSSSLLAVHEACQSLRAGACDLALAGGSNLMLTPDATIGICKLNVAAADGRCKTFAADADGYGRGEGCGVVVLKRFPDAVASGDQILALIRGSATNHDGRSNGLTAPNGAAQEAVIRHALAAARIRPEQVQYVETHGTGTLLGDPIEVLALNASLGDGRQDGPPLLIGSVKTNIGHLEAAAGIAGLIKVILALQARAIPPHLHFSAPNPHIPWSHLPIKVTTALTPWPGADGSRIAGVSAFGMSGTNVHVIVGEAPATSLFAAEKERSPQLFSLSAKSAPALAALAERYAEHLAEHPELRLSDICFTANYGRAHFEQRLAAVAATSGELRAALREFAAGMAPRNIFTGAVSGGSRPQVAFLFTGQGAQYANMGRRLYDSEPRVREIIDDCDELLHAMGERRVLDVLYPAAGSATDALDATIHAQPALFVLEVALARLWQAWGVQPALVVGHSVGEFAAACVAGVFSLEDGLRLVAARGRLMQNLPAGGAMASAHISATRAMELVAPYAGLVAVAAFNGPEDVTISGAGHAVDLICATLARQGVKTQRLTVSHAFHSPLIEPMVAAFAAVAAKITYKPLLIPMLSNVSGSLAGAEIASAAYWVRHLTAPTQFAANMTGLAQSGCRVMIEIEPRPTLLGMARAQLPEDFGQSLPSLRLAQDDRRQMLESLGRLYVAGAPVDWVAVAEPDRVRRLALPTYPFQRQRYWIEPGANRDRRRVAAAERAAQHDLIQRRVRAPLLKATLFETTLDRRTLPFLADHVIAGKTVVAGATHLCMILAALASSGAPGNAQVADLLFTQPLVLAPDATCTLQLVWHDADSGHRSFDLISVEAGEENWTVHATGAVQEDAPEEATMWSSLTAVQARCGTPLPKSNGARGAAAGASLQLGPSFRWTVATWMNAEGSEALALLRRPVATVDRFQPHPGLLDSCFHLFDCFEPAHARDEVYVPFAVSRCWFDPAATLDEVWCRAVVHRAPAEEAARVSGDLYLYDADGQPMAELMGFELRRVPLTSLLRQPDPAKWLYEVEWEPAPVTWPTGNLPCQHWLILADAAGVGHALAERLAAFGVQSTVVEAGEQLAHPRPGRCVVDRMCREQLDALMHEVCSLPGAPAPQQVVDLGGLDAGVDLSVGAFEHALKSSTQALYLVQALAGRLWPDAPRLSIVTQGAQLVGEQHAPVVAAQTSLWGLARVIEREQPDLRCTCVDLDPSAEPAAAADSLLKLLIQPMSPERQWAVRGEECFVARLVHMVREPAPSDALQLNAPAPDNRYRADGAYLITGGFGALGLFAAQHMVSGGARRLALVGRRPPSAEAAAKIARWQTDGVQVSAVCADVADSRQVAALLAEVERNLAPICGVIHAAGVLDDGVLLNQSGERMRGAMAPKAAGAWNLHQLTLTQPLDCFVCFSSAASLLGTAGQSNYATANAFMDGLMHMRRQAGLPGISINWGPWAEAGMAVATGAQAALRWADEGIALMPPERALAALDRLIDSQVAQAAVLDVDWQRYAAGATAQFLARVAPLPLPVDELPRVAPFVEKLLSAPAAEQRGQLKAHVRNLVAGVLHLSAAEQLQGKQSLFDLGLDSLMAIELKSKFERSLGLSLRATLVFDHPTISELEEFLGGMVLPAASEQAVDGQKFGDARGAGAAERLAGMSEAEAEDLLLQELAKLKY